MKKKEYISPCLKTWNVKVENGFSLSCERDYDRNHRPDDHPDNHDGFDGPHQGGHRF